MASSSEASRLSEASYYDSWRFFKNVLAPTLMKGVIKRRPWVEAAAQYLGLDTNAVRFLQEMRKKYGSGPLLVNLLFRSQVVTLDPKDVMQVLEGTPIPFGQATKEKKSALNHFEPGNVLISDPERRKVLRPVHEHALATNERVHPLAERFNHVINEELDLLLRAMDDKSDVELNWDRVSETWFRVIRRISLGDAAREDHQLTEDMGAIRGRGNWGFLASSDKSTLESVQRRLTDYLNDPEEGSLISRFPKGHGAASELELPSQIGQWLFAWDAAGIIMARALALLGCQPDEQRKAAEEAKTAAANGSDRPFSRAVYLDAIRLWPTTPIILRDLMEDATVGGRTVTKGTGVMIFAPFFHRDDQHLEAAHRMSTDRWMDKEVEPSTALVPFSAGPAMCPGHNLVPMVAGLFIAGLLSRATLALHWPKLDPESLPGTLDHTEVKLRISKQIS
ncbi:Cytochrome P450 4c3 [Coniochaeta hoffmannii]|uniref:Cytochrome P450 4c3 n=1 Tax=Coniochaeta hoffmannii TaxID=91930 RepID=A0AA38RLP0_9PEZI|nr:Cytochrome P450 4c3 [Coniochaeta hoffmannii]